MKGGFGFRPRVTVATTPQQANPLADRSNTETPRASNSLLSKIAASNRFEKKKVSFVAKREAQRTPGLSARKTPGPATPTSFVDPRLTSRSTAKQRPDALADSSPFASPEFCPSPEIDRQSRKTTRTTDFAPSASVSLSRHTFLNRTTTLKDARAMRQSVNTESRQSHNQTAFSELEKAQERFQSKPRFQSLIKKPPSLQNRTTVASTSFSKTPSHKFTPSKHMEIKVNESVNFEDTKPLAATTKASSLRFSTSGAFPTTPSVASTLPSRIGFKKKIGGGLEEKTSELIPESKRGSPQEKGFVPNPKYVSNRFSLIREESRDSTLSNFQSISPSPPRVMPPAATGEKRIPYETSPADTEQGPFACELKAVAARDEFGSSFELDLTNNDMPFAPPSNILKDLEEDDDEFLPEQEGVLANKIVLGVSTPNKKLSECGSYRSKVMDEIVPLSKSKIESSKLESSKMLSSNCSSLVELGPSLANQLQELAELSAEEESTKKEKLAVKIQSLWRRYVAMKLTRGLRYERKASLHYKLQRFRGCFEELRKNSWLVRDLRWRYRGDKLISIIRIQLFIKRRLRKTRSVRGFKARFRAVIEGWRVRRLMRSAEIESILRGITDLRNLISEMSAEKETKHSKAFLDQIKRDLPVKIKEFNTAFDKAYEERKWELSSSEEKKAQMRRTMKVKKQKQQAHGGGAKYNPPRLGSKRVPGGKSKFLMTSETTAAGSFNLGLSTQFNEDSFRDTMNQTLNSGGVDSFLGKRPLLAHGASTCREKKKGPFIQEINISPLKPNQKSLLASNSVRRLDRPTPRNKELPILVQELETLFAIVQGGGTERETADAQLEVRSCQKIGHRCKNQGRLQEALGLIILLNFIIQYKVKQIYVFHYNFKGSGFSLRNPDGNLYGFGSKCLCRINCKL